jgi:hypothetical protein
LDFRTLDFPPFQLRSGPVRVAIWTEGGARGARHRGAGGGAAGHQTWLSLAWSAGIALAFFGLATSLYRRAR